MPVETEIKVTLSDLPGFRGRLLDLGGVPLSPGHFEDNHVLDFPDSRLRSRKCLLRVRLVGESAWVTFKGPPLPGELFKKRVGESHLERSPEGLLRRRHGGG